MAKIIKGPSLAEIITKNWTLDEFINEGYLNGGNFYLGNRIRGGKAIPELILKGQDVEILSHWAYRISPQVGQLYTRLGWNTFVDDLIFIHDHPGKLLEVDNKYVLWYRKDNGFKVIISGESLGLVTTTLFEDVFLNVISLEGTQVNLVPPKGIKTLYANPLKTLLKERTGIVKDYNEALQDGYIIQMRGFPNQIAISPLVEMKIAYLLMNNDFEFVLIGTTLTTSGNKNTACVYTYNDGQLILASVSLNMTVKIVDL